MQRFTLALLLLCLQLAAQNVSPDPTCVQTHCGPVTGAILPGTPSLHVWKGIPFAAPPVGELRWMPPAAPTPWSAPRPCTNFGPECPQPALATAGTRPSATQSEDCLYLNVWAQAGDPSVKRPVMVWIHGGGMVVGSGSRSFYDGAAFARAGVVLVTINYRLGPLGFFAHPALSAAAPDGTSGNQGLKDQVAALRWVHENIGAFGGDPGNVTIFGESAGAASVCWLLVVPEAKGLFQRAIAESGGAARAGLLRQAGAESAGLKAQTRLGIAADVRGPDALSQLRAKSATDLLTTFKPTIFRDQGTTFGPHVDGKFTPDAPDVLMARGAFHHVPVLIGTNSGDGSVFMPGVQPRKPDELLGILQGYVGSGAETLLKLYPGVLDAEPDNTQLQQLLTDLFFATPARELARAITADNGQAWLYQFTHVPAPLARRTKAARHGLEIPYVFGNLPDVVARPAEQKLSELMLGTWVQFARTGSPEGAAIQSWPAHTRENDAYFEFATKPRSSTGLRKIACDLIDELRRKPAR